MYLKKCSFIKFGYLWILLFIIFSSSYSNILSQVINEPINKSVYKFLSVVSQKGIIDFNDLVIPISRKYIVRKLTDIKKHKWELTLLQQRELEFYLQDYNLETKSIKNRSVFFRRDKLKRFRLFSYSNSLIKFNIDPILGLTLGSKDNSFYTHRWNGINIYGTLNGWLGFKFNFRDNGETGNKIDKIKSFTPETGIIISGGSENSVEYSEFRTSLGTDWSWGSFSIGKDFLEWGYGESGKIVLSNKAPSFPYLRLDLKLTGWLKFNYFLLKLSSDIIDSTKTYVTKIHSPSFNRRITREKYLASHSLIINPIETLTIALGESIVFSDRFEWTYLIPLMFFKATDHYLSSYDIGQGDNSQFFLSLSSRNLLENTHLWATLFIDEISFENLFDSKSQKNQFAFTIGASITDLPIENLTVNLEYTKIYPFVYNNFIQTQTYENHSYLLGHWMGNNSDMIYGSINYRIIRGLGTNLWIYFIRKGSGGSSEQQYSLPQPPFLFGSKNYFTQIGFNIKYEIEHDMGFIFDYLFNDMKTVTNNFTDKHHNQSFGFSIYYGL